MVARVEARVSGATAEVTVTVSPTPNGPNHERPVMAVVTPMGGEAWPIGLKWARPGSTQVGISVELGY
jgi:hypothetical protein